MERVMKFYTQPVKFSLFIAVVFNNGMIFQDYTRLAVGWTLPELALYTLIAVSLSFACYHDLRTRETWVVTVRTKDQHTDAPDNEAAGKSSGIRTYPGENEAY